MSGNYDQPLALVVISSISIGLGAIAAGCIALDIIVRRGWKSMMWIMIPVYVINALYLWPITLWVYFKYGRPSKPGAGGDQVSHCHDGGAGGQDMQQDGTEQNDDDSDRTQTASADQQQHQHSSNPEQKDEESGHEMRMEEHHHGDSSRPFFATVTVGVCHCGAGCVLGDIVGEWLVYGTNAYIGNPPRLLWAEMLVDFGFAFLFGLFFQYFSIAPMSGDYSIKTVWRALKADALSLISFEIGLFGWMAAFQLGIFNDELGMPTVTYWWMMQIGMFIGHWTGVPVNWWLIKKGVKEPCA